MAKKNGHKEFYNNCLSVSFISDQSIFAYFMYICNCIYEDKMFVCVLLQIGLTQWGSLEFLCRQMTSVNQVAFYSFIIHRNGNCSCNYSCCFSFCWFDQVVAWICQAIKIVQVSNIDLLYIDWISFLTDPIRQSQRLFWLEFWSGMPCCSLHWHKFNQKSLEIITKMNALILN